MAKEGRLTSIMFAGTLDRDSIITSWANAEPGHRQELIGHLQIDVIMGVLETMIE